MIVQKNTTVNSTGNFLSKSISISCENNGFIEIKLGGVVVHSFNFYKGCPTQYFNVDQNYDSFYSTEDCEIFIDEV